MKKSQLLKRFPRASQGVLALNDDGTFAIVGSAGETAELERDSGPALEQDGRNERRDPAKYLVRITSVRIRLLDEDNLCEKFHIDCLRYAGIIPNDAPSQCRIETTQRPCGKGESEKTIIEVYRVTPGDNTTL